MPWANFRQPHIAYAALIFIASLFFLVLNPPFQSPDEAAHFFRSVQLAQGEWRAEMQEQSAGAQIPRAVVAAAQNRAEPYSFVRIIEEPSYRLSRAALFDSLSKSPALSKELRQDKIFTAFPNTVLYSPVPYVATLSAYVVAATSNFSVMTAFYLARMANLLISVLLIALALYRLSFSPRLQLIFFALYSSPMSLYLLSSVSADALTIALSGLVFALGLSLLHEWQEQYFNELFVAALALSLTKMLFFVPALWAAGMFLLAKKPRRGAAIALTVAALAPALLWQLAMAPTYVSARPGSGVDGPAQLHFVLSHLGQYFLYAHKSMLLSLPAQLSQWVGNFGWFTSGVTTPIRTFYVILLFLALNAGGESKLASQLNSRRARIFTAVLFIAFVELVFLAMYLSWNPAGEFGAPGRRYIEGIQGRYFTPIAPMLFFTLGAVPPLRHWCKAQPKIFKLTFSLLWLAIIAATLLQINARYWV